MAPRGTKGIKHRLVHLEIQDHVHSIPFGTEVLQVLGRQDIRLRQQDGVARTSLEKVVQLPQIVEAHERRLQAGATAP